ncbi:MAG: glycosyltransferase [Opitutaceae bacterium]
MPTPLITICLPAFKADRYLSETLASVRAQRFSGWELIVVEDGSRDRTEGLVQEFARQVHQSVRFVRHEKNQGLPATRNTAIELARGIWIALLDADDIWTADHLSHLFGLAQQTGADVLHSGVVMFDSDSGVDLEVRAPDETALAEFPLSLFRRRYPIQPSSTLLRRERLAAVGGFDAGTRYVEDFELWMRLVRTGACFAFSPEATCRYRQHGAAMTRHASAMALGLASVYERNADWPAAPVALRRRLASEGWFAAGRLLFRGDPAEAAECFRKALRHRPYSAVLWIYRCAALGLSGGKSLVK